MEIAGKVVVVTGASMGIGEAVAKLFADRIREAAPDNAAKQVEAAYRIALSRPPRASSSRGEKRPRWCFDRRESCR